VKILVRDDPFPSSGLVEDIDGATDREAMDAWPRDVLTRDPIVVGSDRGSGS